MLIQHELLDHPQHLLRPRVSRWAGLRPRQRIEAFRGKRGAGGLWLGPNFDPKVHIPDAGMVVRNVSTMSLATNYRGLEQLVRSRWGKEIIKMGTSFDRPLGFVSHLMKTAHPWMRKVFTEVVKTCTEVMNSDFGRRSLDDDKGDDLVRKTLALCEESIAESGSIAKVMFSGMSTLGGPRGWEKGTVVELVKNWIQGPTTLFNRESEKTFVLEKLKTWSRSWVGQGVLGDARKIGFQEYKKDFMRWGTSGGCSPTEEEVKYALRHGMIKNKNEKMKLRSKTICGMLAVMTHDTETLLKKTNVCHAALKEETKTRVIISTPMWSYVRMCYVLDCLGTPAFLNSTLSRHDMVVDFVSYYSMNYAAVDASQFDHNVPMWLLCSIWEQLERAVVDRYGEEDELVEICRELRAELEDLKVEVLGESLDYEKGLLSGWRVTSLFGSMISALCCELYVANAQSRGVGRETIGYLTQGDDVILWSCVDDFTGVIDFMRDIGVRTHADKCLIGVSGDFLRALYTREGKICYPMRSLRGIFYAHPWIERRQFQGIAELASNWMQVASRVQMWRRAPDGEMFEQILSEACCDIARWGCGLRSSQVRKLFETPTALGGLGCIETDTGGPYYHYKPIAQASDSGRAFSDMLEFVGFKPEQGYSVKEVDSMYVDMVAVTAAAKKLAPWDERAIPTTEGKNRAGLLMAVTAATSTRKEKTMEIYKDICHAASELLDSDGFMVIKTLTNGVYHRTTRRADLIRLLFGGNPIGLVNSISLDLTVAREKMKWAVNLAKLCLRGMAHRVSKTRMVAASWSVYLSMMRTDATFGQL